MQFGYKANKYKIKRELIESLQCTEIRIFLYNLVHSHVKHIVNENAFLISTSFLEIIHVRIIHGNHLLLKLYSISASFNHYKNKLMIYLVFIELFLFQ